METNDNKLPTLREMPIIGDWVPRKVVQDFFGYGNTKMASFGTDYNVEESKVGKRIFFRHSDILRLLEDNSL